MTEQPSQGDMPYDQLFHRYLDVCNQALEANRDRFPYKQIWEAAGKLMENREIPIAIYDDQPKAVYALRVKNHHIEAEAAPEKAAPEAWHVNTSYLEDVIAHPEEYIRNPAKIDWNWLRNRLGM